MMVDTLAHVNLIRERNPNLNFGLSALPAKDGYEGKRGMPYASWGSVSAKAAPTRKRPGNSSNS